MRAIELNKLMTEKGYEAMEIHPTSTRKARDMPAKDWGKIQTTLTRIGLGGDPDVCILTAYEIDAVTAASTAHLHMQNQTGALGDEKEGYIVVPRKQNWRTILI
jgi:predicted nuclease with RNAse H fold